jgi:hypothetical protein
MSAAHTPGPWSSKHRQGADGMYRTEVFSDLHGGIATCDWTPKHCGDGVTGTYREANARLIAVAPELLDALQAMTEIAEWTIRFSPIPEGADGPIIKARAAIAKATGKAA